MSKTTTMAALLCSLMIGGVNVHAQSLQDRVQAIRMAKNLEKGKAGSTTRDKIGMTFKNVKMAGKPAREAIDQWSKRTGIKVVINWSKLELEGIDPEQPLTMEFKAIPASQLLDLMLRQISPDEKLITRTTDWYIAVMTKRQAMRHRVVRTYHIGELTMDIPDFNNAPSFDLNDALSNTSSGGSRSGSSSQNLFGDEANDDSVRKTKTARGNEIAELVMQTIEPGIWAPAGPCTARYYRGNLIVNAPLYVQEQIGIAASPTISVMNSGSMMSVQGTTSRSNTAAGMSMNVVFTRNQKMRKIPVIKVQRISDDKTSGVQPNSK
ncbi:hypothetical protein JD969_16970 [Planctomycetota bacterium]|nr:hypothetical protein JD969_16970 [Planctomycetota bacterium]